MYVCKFCSKFNTSESMNTYLEWFDEILMESENFLAVPALGQFIEGYLLIISKKHVISMGNLEMKQFDELLDFTKKVSSVIEKLYQKPFIYEHGAASEPGATNCLVTQPAGCCIAHAHWHLIPFDIDFSGIFAAMKLEVYSVDDPKQIIDYAQASMPYLLFMNSFREGLLCKADASPIPSQFFRKWIAAKLNIADQWDWRQFPFEDNIHKTINKFKLLNLG